MISAKDLTNVVFKSYLKHGSPTFETCVSKVHAVRLPMHLVRWKHSCTTAQCLTLILSDLNDAIKKVTSGGVSNFRCTFPGFFLNQILCTRANAFAQTITPPQSLSRKVESAEIIWLLYLWKAYNPQPKIWADHWNNCSPAEEVLGWMKTPNLLFQKNGRVSLWIFPGPADRVWSQPRIKGKTIAEEDSLKNEFSRR